MLENAVIGAANEFGDVLPVRRFFFSKVVQSELLQNTLPRSLSFVVNSVIKSNFEPALL